MEQDNMKIASILDALEKYANDRNLRLWYLVNHAEDYCAFVCCEPERYPEDKLQNLIVVNLREIESLDDTISLIMDQWDRHFGR